MILLLDTTVLIDALRKRQARLEFLDDLVLAGHGLTTSAISVGEVYRGLRSGEERGIAAFLSTLQVHGVTGLIAQRAGLLKSSYARKGVTLELADTIVAATALEYELPLLTDNKRHFPMPELTPFPLP